VLNKNEKVKTILKIIMQKIPVYSKPNSYSKLLAP